MSAARRGAISLVLGLVLGAVLSFAAPWQLSSIAAFDLAALSFVAITWFDVGSLDARTAESRARAEDGSVGFIGVSVIVCSIAALVLEVLALSAAERDGGAFRSPLIVLAVLAVVAGWMAVQSVYTFHYARLYFADDRRGIDFNSDEPPDLGDFLYFAATIAMTYQVSDTNVTDRRIRRAVTRHALLSFLFGTAIIGTTINVMASLIGR